MKYVGLQSQIWKNNFRSVLLLIMFPLVFYALVFVFYFLFDFFQEEDVISNPVQSSLRTLPLVTVAVALWFIIAWFSHSTMINRATGSRPLERTENKRVYNLVENLCMSVGQKMPKVNIIEDDSLNAFASGISNKSYTISLSRGIIDKLDDDELEGVIAHELTHIRNRDVRLLIVSIVFVGIFAFITQALLRTFMYGGGRRNNKNGAALVIIMLLAAIGWLLSTLFRFALSRKREYMADAGAAELTHKPGALASALRKVSSDARIEAVTRQDVAQMFIENPGDKKKKASFSSMFATHPPIAERIQILEQW
ncbi:MAG: M48 family metallopeptidase [Marinilabiliaceae bacterium]|nr:M48 family metallopeptidase [Marinilabiliaceae bacterium]